MLDWIKKNWKSVVLLGIPVLVSWVLSLIRKNQSLQNKVEMKDKELDIEKEVDELGDKLVLKATEKRDEVIEKVIEDHKLNLARIAAEEQERIEAIKSAEDATEAIKEALEVPSWKKLKPSDIKPPKFPDPLKANRNRSCPCGSGFKYKYCHAKQWSEK